MFCTLTSAILIGRADGVRIRVCPSHCDCEFCGTGVSVVFRVIKINNMTTLVKSDLDCDK